MSRRSHGLMILAGLVLTATAMAWAQEPRIFQQPVWIAGGNLNILTSRVIVFEGATDDAFETTLTVGDPTADRTWTVPDAASDTLVGLAATQTLTNKTLSGATVTTGTVGKATEYVAARQEFMNPCFVAELADGTAELVTDAGVNRVVCGGGLGIFSFRIDGAQASPWIVGGGYLDVDNDGADNEGVDIVAADRAATTHGLITGTSPAMYTRASITIASVSGTDNLSFGWRIAAAHIDNQVPETIDTGGMFNLNDTAGNIEIQTADDGTDADDEEDQVGDWADGETHTLEVRMSTAGVFTFFIDGLESTITTATGAAAAGDVMVPFFSQLNESDADTETKINWWEVGEVL